MLFNHQQQPSPHFACITLFTTALCNLNCSYCYICKDKNGGLKKIDEDLEKMYETGEYIETVLDIDPEAKDYIKELSLWGGEPFLGIYRLIDHLDEFFINFPNINFIDTSTNLTLPDHYKRIQDLIDAIDKNYHLLNLSKHGSQKFKISIQISIDGPEEMNDITRGSGSTKKICDNWKEVVNNLKFDPCKYEIEFFTKTTLSRSSWKFIDTPEKAYKWCEFFHKALHEPWEKSGCEAYYRHGLWNNAAPTEWTKEDGLKYAEVSRIFQKIFPKVKEDFSSFRSFVSIVPESILAINTLKEEHDFNFKSLQNYFKCRRCGMGCGVFSFNIVPIPNKKFTMCHRGLFDAYTEYTNNLSQQEHLNDLATMWSTIDTRSWVLNKEGLLQMHKTINKLYEYENQIFFTDAVQQIKTYADNGIIDSKYSNIENILPTLGFFLLTAQCIQDCFIFGGTWTTRTPLEIPLMYNGTMDVIVEEIERVIKEQEDEYNEKLQSL